MKRGKVAVQLQTNKERRAENQNGKKKVQNQAKTARGRIKKKEGKRGDMCGPPVSACLSDADGR